MLHKVQYSKQRRMGTAAFRHRIMAATVGESLALELVKTNRITKRCTPSCGGVRFTIYSVTRRNRVIAVVRIQRSQARRNESHSLQSDSRAAA
jgi:hypothetical protein